MTLTVDVEGLEVLRRKIDVLEKRIKRQVVQEATFAAATQVEGDIIAKIHGGPATGRPRGDGSIASAPGEYPMTDDGILAANINSDRIRNGAEVVSRAEYSEALEYKGTNPLTMEYTDPSRGGRPFMRRGLHENENRIHEIVTWAARRLLGSP